MDDEKSGEFKPPYLSFKTYWGFIDELLALPLPPALDRSLMKTKSGTDQLNLTSALRSFGLIDADQVITGLKDLEGSDEAARISWLAASILENYPAQMAVSESNGTEQQLRQSFREAFNLESADTQRKAMTFFLHAAQKAGIKLSPRFPATRSGSGAPGVSKPKRTATKRTVNKPDTGQQPPPVIEPAAGFTKSVSLPAGGTLAVTVTVNPMELKGEHRKFFYELIDALDAYAESHAAPTERPQYSPDDSASQAEDEG